MSRENGELARELDEHFGALEMSPSRQRDIAFAIAAAQQRRRDQPPRGVWVMGALAAAALVAAAVWAIPHAEPAGPEPTARTTPGALVPREEQPPHAATSPAPQLPAQQPPAQQARDLLALGVVVRGNDCDVAYDERQLQLSGHCQLDHRRAKLHLEVLTSPTTLRLQSDGVRVVQGRVLFKIEKDSQRAFPVRVGVSHGVIEVLGTRFVVVQEPAGGTVDLFEGGITFVDAKGEVHRVAVGQRYGWGHHAKAADGNKSRRRMGSVQPNPTPLDAAAVLDDAERLRASGRAAEALAQLRALPRKRLSARMAEVVSYEIGTLLDDRLRRHDQACTHWEHHNREFSQGRYQAAVERRLAALRCDQE